MSITVVERRLQFSAGHRVHGHETLCKNPHGHNYVVHIVATAARLDPIGRIIDFKVLKEKFGNWIDTMWDHGFIWFEKDKDMEEIYGVEGLAKNRGWKNFKAPFNPTAEEMAKYLLLDIAPKLMVGTGVKIVAIEIEETENCKAKVTA